MPRKNLIRTNQFPYHVTIRTNNKKWFDIPINLVWKMCLRSLGRARFKYPVRIEAFVLMSNHYHLLLLTPDANLDKFMYAFNSQLSWFIRKETGRINRVFGDRYRWQLVESQDYYKTVVRYIFQNPVRAKISKSCVEYPYSSLHYQFYKKDFVCELPKRFIESNYINYFEHMESTRINLQVSRVIN